VAELADGVSAMTAILECSLIQRQAGRNKRKQRADRDRKTDSDRAESGQSRGQTEHRRAQTQDRAQGRAQTVVARPIEDRR
jgi:hypothetical protein